MRLDCDFYLANEYLTFESFGDFSKLTNISTGLSNNNFVDAASMLIEFICHIRLLFLKRFKIRVKQFVPIKRMSISFQRNSKRIKRIACNPSNSSSVSAQATDLRSLSHFLFPPNLNEQWVRMITNVIDVAMLSAVCYSSFHSPWPQRNNAMITLFLFAIECAHA